MRKKKILATLLTASLAFSMVGGFTAQADDLGDPINLTVTLTAVSTDTHAEAMMVFKDTVEELSDGNITVDVYTDAQLFSQEEETLAVANGDADMALSSASWLTTGSPWISMFTAGYLFNSYDHMTTVLNGEIGQQVFQQVSDEQGLLPLGAWYLGARDISLGEDKQVLTPDDLSGVTLRMANTDAWLFLGEALGANPTPMSFSELYLALQTGAVDGQDNPLGSVYNAKFYEVQKSITLTQHLIDSVWPTITTSLWESMTEAQQDIILQGVEAGREYCDTTNLQLEDELVEFFEDEGLSVYEADIPTFQEHVLNYYLDSDFSSDWDMDLYDQVQEIGEQFLD